MPLALTNSVHAGWTSISEYGPAFKDFSPTMGVSSVCMLDKLAALETQHDPGAAPQLITDEH